MSACSATGSWPSATSARSTRPGSSASSTSRSGRRARVHRPARALGRLAVPRRRRLASHLHQGFTTQLSGNCGDTLAPITAAGRELVELALRPQRARRALDDVRGIPRPRSRDSRSGQRGLPRRARHHPRLGPGAGRRAADGHGARRRWSRGRRRDGRRRDRPLDRADLRPRDARAAGRGRGTGRAPRPGAAGSTRPTCATSATGCSSRSTSRSRRSARAGAGRAAPGLAPQVRRPRGCLGPRRARRSACWRRARAEGLDVAADQYPYTAAATTLATILPPALLGLGVDACVAALADPTCATWSRPRSSAGISGWENVARDPGWGGIRISYAASHPDWSGPDRWPSSRDVVGHADPADARLRGADRRPPRRLDRHRLHERAGRRDDHGRAVDLGLHRCRGTPARPPDPRRREAAPADLRQHGQGPRHVRAGPRHRAARGRGRQAHVRAGRPARASATAAWSARAPSPTSSSSIPATIADAATYLEPARHPAGIDHVIVNGGLAVEDGRETGVRTGRLLRRGAVTAATEIPGRRATSPAARSHYTLRRSPRARALRVVIHPDRGVVVTVPARRRSGWGDPERHVVTFLAAREAWLRRHLARQAARTGRPRVARRAAGRRPPPLPRRPPPAAPRPGTGHPPLDGGARRSASMSRP